MLYNLVKRCTTLLDTRDKGRLSSNNVNFIEEKLIYETYIRKSICKFDHIKGTSLETIIVCGTKSKH